jgi:hypothetical protein
MKSPATSSAIDVPQIPFPDRAERPSGGGARRPVS